MPAVEYRGDHSTEVQHISSLEKLGTYIFDSTACVRKARNDVPKQVQEVVLSEFSVHFKKQVDIVFLVKTR